MKQPRPSRRILLAAAILSLGSHWLLLRGVDLGLDAGWGAQPDQLNGSATVMLTAVSPAAPRSIPKKASTAPPATSAVSATSTAAAQTDPANSPGKENERKEPEQSVDPQAHDRPSDAPDVRGDARSLPQSGQLQFQVYLGEGDGEPLAAMTHTLKFDDGHYEMSSRGEALGFMALLYSGLLTQHSSGIWDELGFSTRQYSEQRGKKPEARATVDATRQEVQFSNGGQTALSGLQVNDRLSVIYQMGLQLRSHGNRYVPPVMAVVSASSVENWQFVRVGTEKLRFGELSIDTLHFRRQPPEGSEKTAIDIWYDTGPDPWPMQIRLTDKKGMVITQKRALLSYPGKKQGS